METPSRIFAVDWSGAKDRASIRKKIWLAEANGDGLRTLECGFDSRECVAKRLIGEAKNGGADFIAGLDFAFSFPAWFIQQENRTDVFDFWQHVAAETDNWLKDPPPLPFYVKGSGPEDSYRRTEKLAARRITGQRPDNVFHLTGAKQVGKGSIRGMPILNMLRSEGFSIWPFDPPKLPCVVEIYPRLFYGNLKKNRTRERLDFLEPLPIPDKYHRADATCSDDAFDAAVSALKMYDRREEFARLKQTEDAVERLEGCIWG